MSEFYCSQFECKISILPKLKKKSQGNGWGCSNDVELFFCISVIDVYVESIELQ